MGQVPALLSLPLPLQGDRREESPRFVSYLFLFSRDPRFQGPTEPRTPLGPPARSAPGRSAPSRPRLCNSPGQRGRGCQLPPRWPPLPPPPRFCMPGRGPKHTPPRSRALAPSALIKHTPLPHH